VIMSYKQEVMVLNGHNYGMWKKYMETLLRTKTLCSVLLEHVNPL
jgi:hypothetical protein